MDKKNIPSFLNKHIFQIIEYVLVFSKNKNKLLKLQGKRSTKKSRSVLNVSNISSKRFLRPGTPECCQNGIDKRRSYTNRTLTIE
jgi:adenine-specific DNA-methyltransferase